MNGNVSVSVSAFVCMYVWMYMNKAIIAFNVFALILFAYPSLRLRFRFRSRFQFNCLLLFLQQTIIEFHVLKLIISTDALAIFRTSSATVQFTVYFLEYSMFIQLFSFCIFLNDEKFIVRLPWRTKCFCLRIFSQC